MYKCGVRIRDLRPEEAGEWRCEMEEYHDGKGGRRGKSPRDRKSFYIDVEAKGASSYDAQIIVLVLDFESSYRVEQN